MQPYHARQREGRDCEVREVHCGAPQIFAQIGAVGPGCGRSANEGEEALLSALGYLAVTPTGKLWWKATLTDKGLKFLEEHKESPYSPERKAGCEAQQANFPVAEREMMQVTGIVENGATARVDFLWKWKLNEIGNALADKSARNLTAKQWAELDYYWAYRAETCRQDPVCLQYTPAIAEFKTGGFADLPHKGLVIFTKFDDGWRLE